MPEVQLVFRRGDTMGRHRAFCSRTRRETEPEKGEDPCRSQLSYFAFAPTEGVKDLSVPPGEADATSELSFKMIWPSVLFTN